MNGCVTGPSASVRALCRIAHSFDATQEAERKQISSLWLKFWIPGGHKMPCSRSDKNFFKKRKFQKDHQQGIPYKFEMSSWKTVIFFNSISTYVIFSLLFMFIKCSVSIISN